VFEAGQIRVVANLGVSLPTRARKKGYAVSRPRQHAGEMLVVANDFDKLAGRTGTI
jgi:hypothetical protein